MRPRFMKLELKPINHVLRTLTLCFAVSALAQAPNPPQREGGTRADRPPQSGPGGFVQGGPGPGGFGMNQQETKLVKRFDKDNNGWLNAAERKAAREFLAKERAEGR